METRDVRPKLMYRAAGKLCSTYSEAWMWANKNDDEIERVLVVELVDPAVNRMYRFEIPGSLSV